MWGWSWRRAASDSGSLHICVVSFVARPWVQSHHHKKWVWDTAGCSSCHLFRGYLYQTFNLVLERLKDLEPLGKSKMISVRDKRKMEESIESWDLRAWIVSVSIWELLRPLEDVTTM